MKNETKHTPGPWHRCCNSPHSIQICTVDTKTDEPNGVIVEVLKRAWCNDEQVGANARLIASAPDLLAALIRAEHVMHENLGPDMPEQSKAIVQARATIAKATEGDK